MATQIDNNLGFAIGDNVALKRPSGDFTILKVTNKDAFSFVINESSVGANTGTSDYAEVTQTNPVKGEFLQFTGIGILGQVVVRIAQPASVRRLGTDKVSNGGALTERNSPIGSEFPINLFTVEQQSISRRIENYHIAAVAPTIRYIGFRYRANEQGHAENIEDYKKNKSINAPISIASAGF